MASATQYGRQFQWIAALALYDLIEQFEYNRSNGRPVVTSRLYSLFQVLLF